MVCFLSSTATFGLQTESVPGVTEAASYQHGSGSLQADVLGAAPHWRGLRRGDGVWGARGLHSGESEERGE